jgi:hypothetical protein
MKNRVTLPLAVFLLLFSCLPAFADPASEAARVQDDVRALANAAYEGDVDTTLRYTHPAILEGMGGEAQVRSALEQNARAVAERGMKLATLTFPEPPKFIDGTECRFAIVPTLSVIQAGEQRIESLNFQLGVLEKGVSAWTYVEGSRINKDNVRILFPDFPADYTFPSTYRKKL